MWDANHSTKKGFMIRAPMVLEAEFSRPDSGIDDDFPKLVMARADVRVWLSWSVAARNHIGLFKDQIREFPYSLPGDDWVFGIYDWRLRTPVIERYTVAQEDLIRAAATAAHGPRRSARSVAATSKSLAKSNKSCTGGNATNKRGIWQPTLIR
jgi:hypothetical protein